MVLLFLSVVTHEVPRLLPLSLQVLFQGPLIWILTPVPLPLSLYHNTWSITLTVWLPLPAFLKIQFWSSHSCASVFILYQLRNYVWASWSGLASAPRSTNGNSSLSTFPHRVLQTHILLLHTYCYFCLQPPFPWLLSVTNSYWYCKALFGCHLLSEAFPDHSFLLRQVNHSFFWTPL